MQEFTQAEAARELGIRPSTVRSAVSRGTLVAHEDAAGQTVITEWELERYRRRREAFSLSAHLQELPAANDPLPLVLQTSLAATTCLGERPATLLRVYRLADRAGARAIVVLGDLQHYSSATLREHWDALIAAARPQVAAVLDGDDDPTAVAWVTLGGFLDEGIPELTDITVLGVAQTPDNVAVHAMDMVGLRRLESRIGQRVLTWPAVYPDAIVS